MRFLLDTHVWLWMLSTPERLGPSVLEIVEDTSNTLLLSAASSWEIAMKYAIGRLTLPEPPEAFVPERMRASGIDGMPVEHSHALHVSQLPLHHRDPFDRLLISQAELESVPVVTSDPIFSRYEVEIVHVG